MKKLFTIALLLLFKIGLAQSLTAETVDKKMMDQVVGEAIYILQQDYYLLDTSGGTHKKLGLKNQKYFGRVYTLAILAGGQFHSLYHLDEPWLTDPNYLFVSTQKKYIPVLSDLSFRKLKENRYYQLETSPQNDSIKKLPASLLQGYSVIDAPDTLSGLKFLPSPHTVVDTTSWFWTASSRSRAGSDSLNVFQDNTDLGFEVSKGKFIPSKNTFSNTSFFYNKKSLGGFIFMTKASLGKVEYFLKGLVVKNGNNFKFVSIEEMPAKSDEKKKPESTTVAKDSKLILTEIIKTSEKSQEKNLPVKKKKKN